MSQNEIAAIDLADPTLFGNDAAEDENRDVFESYFVDRNETQNFLDDNRAISILRAYRGEGKSAILRKAYQQLAANDILTVKTTGPSLTPTVAGNDTAVWTKGWKRSIFSLLASEVGTTIGMAWSDDAMALVEEAERNGFRTRSFVSSVLDRLKVGQVPQRTPQGVADPEKTMKRWVGGRRPIWLFVDDIDENFQNTPECRAKIAAFFGAVRQIVNAVPEVRVRVGVRPNVWSILRSEAESLSKAEQYVIDLRWDIPALRSILARRIEGYLTRTNQNAVLSRFCDMSGANRDERIIALVFEEQMPWGYDRENQKQLFRSPHIVMSTLSRHRPRWLIELAKLAGSKVPCQKGLITKSHVTSVLDAFGRQRISDLAAEFSSECPQVHEIINAFAQGREEYSTAELNTTITNRILQGVPVTISGKGKVTKPTVLAGFLYEIGFLTAREELSNGKYKHYMFAEEPTLLHTRTNLDHGVSWEIHPVFRQALGLRTETGQKNRLDR